MSGTFHIVCSNDLLFLASSYIFHNQNIVFLIYLFIMNTEHSVYLGYVSLGISTQILVELLQLL